MNGGPACGDRGRLQDLLDDRLPEDEQAELVGHLEGCEDCRRVFEDIAAGGRWGSEARRFAPGARGLDGAPATVTVPGVDTASDEPGIATATEADVSAFLDPPAEP